MLRYTIGDVLKMKWSGCEYQIYLFRHDRSRAVLYVGQSTCPLLRTRQHINASSKLRIGIILRECMPDTLNWLVEDCSVAERDAVVQQHAKEDYESYTRRQRSYSLMCNSALIAEKAMIAHLKPLYNFSPGRYNGQRIT